MIILSACGDSKKDGNAVLNDKKAALGEKLRIAREAKGKRQSDVNLETQMSIKNISLMENGRCNAGVDTYHRYITYLGGRLIIDVEFPTVEEKEEEG